MTKGQLWIEVDMGEPCQAVGCYTLKWGRAEEPEYAFVRVPSDALEEFAGRCRRNPDSDAVWLWEQIVGITSDD